MNLIKLMKLMKLKLWSVHIKDIALNTIAFGAYIAIQQLVIMPILSKVHDDVTFSNIILFVSIFNIVCIIIGDELGNTRLIRSNVYKDKQFQGDFHVILAVLICVCSIICILANTLIKMDWEDLMVYICITVLGIIRYFSMSYYKLKQRFEHILMINVIYCLGALAGIYMMTKVRFPMAPFLFGEVFACIFVTIVILRDKEHRISFIITPEFNNSITTFSQLSTISIIINCMTYLDRIIIYPVLGATAMAVYYSASAMSKMMSLAINPISGVIMAKLSQVNDNKKGKVVATFIKPLIPVFFLITIGSMILSYGGVKLLYPNYFEAALPILLPICIAMSFSAISFLLKPVIMRFFSIKDFLFANILYAVVFCICMYFFSIWWGIAGFAWASGLAQFTQLVLYIWMLTSSHPLRRKRLSHDNGADK